MTIPAKQTELEIDTYALLLASVLPLVLLAVYIAPVFRTAYRLVSEKETKIRESMRMMGLKGFPYWASWFSYYMIINTILSFIVWAMLFFSGSMVHSDPLIVFLVPWIYGMSVFGMVVVAQSFFENSILGAMVITVLYCGSFVINQLVDVPTYSTSTKMLGSLSPPVCQLFIIRTLSQFEQANVGVSWQNVWSEYENVSVAHGLLMLLLDFVVLTLLGLYLDNVLPKSIGVRQHPCFCLSRAFCCGQKGKGKKTEV